jgi:hypothetical protein
VDTRRRVPWDFKIQGIPTYAWVENSTQTQWAPSENVPPGGASLGYGVLITKFFMENLYEVKMLSFSARYMSTRLEDAIVFH